MTEQNKQRKWTVPAIQGDVNVKCLVCGNDTFMDSGPPDAEDRPGFRHVTIGLNKKNQVSYKVIRRKFCANCGYIMEFMIPGKGGE